MPQLGAGRLTHARGPSQIVPIGRAAKRGSIRRCVRAPDRRPHTKRSAVGLGVECIGAVHSALDLQAATALTDWISGFASPTPCQFKLAGRGRARPVRALIGNGARYESGCSSWQARTAWQGMSDFAVSGVCALWIGCLDGLQVAVGVWLVLR